MKGPRVTLIRLAAAAAVAGLALAPGTRTSEAASGGAPSVDAESAVSAFAVRFSAVQGYEPVHFYLGARSTSGVATVPEPAAHGFASWYDFGLAEAAIPEPLPGRALCDTQAGNIGDANESSLSDGQSPFAQAGVHDGRFLAACTRAPAAEASSRINSLDGGPLSVGASDAFTTTEVEVGGAVVGRAVSTLSDVLLEGGVHIGEVRLSVTLRSDGDGVEVSVDQAVTGAEVGGIPVVIDLDGVRLDEDATPAPLRSEWDAAWREYMEGPCGCAIVPGRVAVDDRDPAAPRASVVGPMLFGFSSGGFTLGGAEVELVHRGDTEPPPVSGGAPLSIPGGTGSANGIDDGIDDLAAGPVRVGGATASSALSASPSPSPELVASPGSASRRVVEELVVTTRKSRWPALAVTIALAWLVRELVLRNPDHRAVRLLAARWEVFARGYLRG